MRLATYTIAPPHLASLVQQDPTSLSGDRWGLMMTTMIINSYDNNDDDHTKSYKISSDRVLAVPAKHHN